MYMYLNKKYTKDLLKEIQLASKSYKCKVAAAVVDKKGIILGVGINHNGLSPLEKTPCCNLPVVIDMAKKDFCIYCYSPKAEFITYSTVVHAEVEAFKMYEVFKKPDVEPALVYITREPCVECKKLLQKYKVDYKVEEII